MRKYIFLSVLVLLIFAACQNKADMRSKAYTYEVVMQVMNNSKVLLDGEERLKEWTRQPDTIMMVNDTTAYLDAYRRLCSYKVFYTMLNEEGSEKTVYPGKFILKNAAGKDVVATLDLPERRAKEDLIWQNVLDFERKYYKQDSIKLQKLEKAEQPRF